MKKIFILFLIVIFNNAQARDDGYGGEYTYKINSIKTDGPNGPFVDMTIIYNNREYPEYTFERLLVACGTKRTETYKWSEFSPQLKQTLIRVKPLGTTFYSGPNGTGVVIDEWSQEKIQGMIKHGGGYGGEKGGYIWRDDGTPEVLAVCK
jgi:hypothetical protein